jgi:hypothetical protein
MLQLMQPLHGLQVCQIKAEPCTGLKIWFDPCVELYKPEDSLLTHSQPLPPSCMMHAPRGSTPLVAMMAAQSSSYIAQLATKRRRPPLFVGADVLCAACRDAPHRDIMYVPHTSNRVCTYYAVLAALTKHGVRRSSRHVPAGGMCGAVVRSATRQINSATCSTMLAVFPA